MNSGASGRSRRLLNKINSVSSIAELKNSKKNIPLSKFKGREEIKIENEDDESNQEESSVDVSQIIKSRIKDTFEETEYEKQVRIFMEQRSFWYRIRLLVRDIVEKVS